MDEEENENLEGRNCINGKTAEEMMIIGRTMVDFVTWKPKA
jgi:hypothetical protein